METSIHLTRLAGGGEEAMDLGEKEQRRTEDRGLDGREALRQRGRESE